MVSRKRGTIGLSRTIANGGLAWNNSEIVSNRDGKLHSISMRWQRQGSPARLFERSPELKHTNVGIISMANGSQFFITLLPPPALDGSDIYFFLYPLFL
ncbi:conserved hypothetical protein [Ricinus communis]|uniref:PPIase cyclophilin-type domain-containing protein n=1 Tax=Ricinus communis TaxID=3988 RepID=B9RX23_RICCO|nr:conserved hypothetical protein [Ricinus communis]